MDLCGTVDFELSSSDNVAQYRVDDRSALVARRFKDYEYFLSRHDEIDFSNCKPEQVDN